MSESEEKPGVAPEIKPVAVSQNAERHPAKALREQSIRSQKTRQILKWTGLSAALLFMVATGTWAGKLYWGNPYIRRLLPKLIANPGAARDFSQLYPVAENFPRQNVINVLILGCDHNYDERMPNRPLKKSRGRSDAILLARVDLDNKTIQAISIPRDTAVQIPGHRVHKINAAYAFGGPELTLQTIESVFGLRADYYVTVNFQAFERIIDSIGGVDITVRRSLNYDDNWGNLHIHLEPGPQHLNGYQAMGFVRMRHSDSDFMRTQRQQEFMEAVRQKVKSPAIITKIPDALSALSEGISSNMTHEQMLSLIAFAKSLPKESVQIATLPSFEGPSFVYVNVSKSQELIRQLFFNGDLSAPININVPDRGRLVSAQNNRKKREKKGAVEDPDAPLDEGADPEKQKREESPNTPQEEDQTPKGTEKPSGKPQEPGDKNEKGDKTPQPEKPAPPKEEPAKETPKDAPKKEGEGAKDAA